MRCLGIPGRATLSERGLFSKEMPERGRRCSGGLQKSTRTNQVRTAVIHTFLLSRRRFELHVDWQRRYALMSRPADPVGFKGSAKGESPAAPFVTEMARAVIGQKGDDTSIITPNLELVSMRPTATS